jgi:hypothetical protein
MAEEVGSMEGMIEGLKKAPGWINPTLYFARFGGQGLSA